MQLACAQDEVEGAAAVSNGENEWRFIFGGAYTHRFETDLDSGDGNVSLNTLSAGIDASTDIHRDLSVSLRMNLGLSDYSFGGSNGFGGLDPWESVHTIAFGAAASFQTDDRWTIFGGPVFQFSRESGASWGDAFTGGAIIGATYVVHDHLLIGGGLGVVSQIEDDVRFFPIIIVEWEINDQWRISSRGASGGRTSIEFTGVELIWSPARHWDFALGGGSSFSRFRLDDDGMAPDGVGEDESTPIWLRASYRPSSQVTFDAVAGMGFGGKMKLDDERGNRVVGSDYDSPFFIGLFGSIRF